ncbi:MAG: Flp pilus assembly complex ATPase component TadA [Candidatus Nomurabacteria bacterium]|nr:MAG: Flp pilus assembly complex ATPase component TadA [Candidatus Nomurabacteria bacterium]
MSAARRSSSVQDDSVLGMPRAIINDLEERGLISEETLAQYVEQAKAKKFTLERILLDTRAVREEDITKAKGKLFNVPYVELFGKIVRAEVLNLIPQELAQNYSMVAFSRDADELSVAMVNPSDFKALEAIEFIARKNRLKLKYFIASETGVKHILQQYESLSAEVEEALKDTESEGDAEVKLNIAEPGMEEVIRQAPVSKMVSVIMRHAVEGKASDVHIEPVGNESRIRYRIDGVLHTSLVLPKHVHASIVARIKVLSNLKIDETRVPQDGRFRMNIDGRDVDYRVSTLPLVNQEKVVMRILDTSGAMTDLQDLGFDGRNYEIIQENIDKSHGMILVTGPTGSGKSTTLYAIMSRLNEESVNIVTLEDPVEYYMKGVNQSQINPDVGLTFAAGLRSILRQDPDIVMVGEIRDTETADLGVHASLTGHVVLSTLHTNDAFGAIPRFIDMKIEPFLLASSLNVVIAQRLVRRICQHCTTTMEIPAALQKEVQEGLKELKPEQLPKGISLNSPKFYRGKGCVRCENTGYKGRVAIAEVLDMTENLKKVITGEQARILENIHEEFNRQGLLTMKQDGLLKALRGLTTIEEVWDATRE